MLSVCVVVVDTFQQILAHIPGVGTLKKNNHTTPQNNKVSRENEETTTQEKHSSKKRNKKTKKTGYAVKPPTIMSPCPPFCQRDTIFRS
jgi:hypothetical protein